MDQFNETNNELKAENTELKNKIKDLSIKNNIIEAKIKYVKSKNEISENEIQKLIAKNSNVEAEALEFTSKYSALEAESSNLKDKIKELLSKCSTLEIESSNLKDEINDLISKCSSLETEIPELKTKNTSLQAEVESLTSLNKTAQKEIEDLVGDIKQFKGKIKIIENESKAKIKRLTEKIKLFGTDVENFITLKTSLESKIESLSVEKTNAEASIEQLKSELNTCEDKIAKLNSENSTSSAKIIKLNETALQNDSLIDNYQYEIGTKVEFINKLKNMNEDSLFQIDELSSKKDSLESKISSLTSKITDLKKEHAEKMSKLTAENVELSSKQAAECKQLKMECEESAKKIMLCEGQLKEKDEVNKSLTSKIQEQEHEIKKMTEANASCFKIPINIPKRGETRKNRMEEKNKINQDQKLEIDAAIVRTMKRKKEVEHSILVSEVLEQLSHRFKPKVIKARIEYLIEQRYMKRIDYKWNIYKYLC